MKKIFGIALLFLLHTFANAQSPTAYFTMDTTVLCDHYCISFQDHSLGEPTSWYWVFEGATPEISTEQNPTDICFHGPGIHSITLTVTNENGFDETIGIVEVVEAPSITAVGDTTIEMGGVVILEITEVDDGVIFWEPPEGLSCTDCMITTASPGIETTYYASVMGVNDCIGRDSVTVIVEFEDVVDVPKAFSPNGDGMNDRLRPLGPGLKEIDFKVYNRFGQMLYSTTDPTDSWDGSYNGQPLNQGVFFWTLEYELFDGKSGKKTGDVTLFK